MDVFELLHKEIKREVEEIERNQFPVSYLNYPTNVLFRVYLEEREDKTPLLYYRFKVHYTPIGRFWRSERLENLLDDVRERHGLTLWKLAAKEQAAMFTYVYKSNDSRDRGIKRGHNIVIINRNELTSFITFLASLDREKFRELFDNDNPAYPLRVFTMADGKKRVCQFSVEAYNATREMLPPSPESWIGLENYVKNYTAKEMTDEDFQRIKEYVASLISQRNSEDHEEVHPRDGKVSRVSTVDGAISWSKELDDDIPFLSDGNGSSSKGYTVSSKKEMNTSNEEPFCQLAADVEADPELRDVFPGGVGFGKYPGKHPVCAVCAVREDCMRETENRKRKSL